MLYSVMAITFMAGTLQGFSGFGYSLLALPLLCVFVPARWAVPVIAVSSLSLNVMVFTTFRRNLNLKGFLPMAVAGVVFTPAGAWLLGYFSDSTVRVIIGAIVAGASALSLYTHIPTIKRTAFGMTAAGVLSGIFNGLTTFSGPPAVIYLSAVRAEKNSFRANLSAFFIVLTIASIPSFIGAGIASASDLLQAAVYIPGAAAGGVAGILISKKVDSSSYRKAVLVILSLLGVLGALQALV